MSELRERQNNSLTARMDEPLIAVPVENGEVRYFTNRDDVNQAIDQDSVQKALGLAGAWSDLDSDEMLAALDRIRHESVPTRPITFVD